MSRRLFFSKKMKYVLAESTSVLRLILPVTIAVYRNLLYCQNHSPIMKNAQKCSLYCILTTNEHKLLFLINNDYMPEI